MPTIRLLLLITGNLRTFSWIEAILSQPFVNDVAVGHHADQFVVFANGDGAYIMLAH